jgi:hypothetical protein
MTDEPIILTGPITRVCPACNAKPGQPCTQPTDTSRRNVSWFHYPREEEVNDR